LEQPPQVMPVTLTWVTSAVQHAFLQSAAHFVLALDGHSVLHFFTHSVFSVLAAVCAPAKLTIAEAARRVIVIFMIKIVFWFIYEVCQTL